MVDRLDIVAPKIYVLSFQILLHPKCMWFRSNVKEAVGSLRVGSVAAWLS